MAVEQLPPPTPDEIAASLRSLLETCSIRPVDDDDCTEIDYCIEHLLTLAKLTISWDVAIKDKCEMRPDGIGVGNFPGGWFHRYSGPCPKPSPTRLLSGSQMIDNERTRQITSEGWSAQYDDKHADAELVEAARAYMWAALCEVKFGANGQDFNRPPNDWPKEWDREWWKPSDDPIRNLVKAGALIAAEIDRLHRKA